MRLELSSAAAAGGFGCGGGRTLITARRRQAHKVGAGAVARHSSLL